MNRNQLYADCRRNDDGEPTRSLSRSRSAAVALAQAPAQRAGAAARYGGRRRDWPQFRGNARLDRRRHRRAACAAQAALEVRSGRLDRLVAGHRRTAPCTSDRSPAISWPSTSRPARCAGSTRRAASDRRVVAGGCGRNRLRRRRRRRRARRPGGRRTEASGPSRPTQEVKSSPVVAGEHGACRLLRRLSLRARRRDGQAAVEVRDRWAPCTPRRPCRTASCLHRRLRRELPRRSASQTGKEVVRDSRRRQHRRVAGHRRRSRLLRDLQQRGAGVRHQGAARFSGGTRTLNGSFRSTRRRRSSAAA